MKIAALVIGMSLLLPAMKAYSEEGKLGWLKSIGKKLAEEKTIVTERPTPVAGSRGLSDDQTVRELKEDSSTPAIETSENAAASCGEKMTPCRKEAEKNATK